MILLHGLFITAVVQPVLTCEGNCIKIGVVSNGTENISTENIFYFGLNISLVKYQIDTSEVYHIFRSVKQLDADDDVDAITLFDYDASILRMPQLLNTSNKKLIMWGERRRDNPHSNKYSFFSEDSLLTLLAPTALTIIVKQSAWRCVFIFYETSTEVEASDLVDALSKEGVLLSLFNIDHERSLHNLLQRIYEFEAKKYQNQEINFIVLCQFYCARTTLRTANTFDALNRSQKTLLKMFSRWLVVVYGQSHGVPHTLKACANDLDNVAIVAFPGVSGNGLEVLMLLIMKQISTF
ncbi:uncharacterized protein LOC123555399 [Mercenaria mercenaria]|uniref:uncharacterized protein LOC123555399 n=1 Tax=Mercenaria mercenaria TaxID=6596 RepID=UPI00234E7780|nr:uncharacterized protein LOC123555399 [Mercenaria mercenaria]